MDSFKWDQVDGQQVVEWIFGSQTSASMILLSELCTSAAEISNQDCNPQEVETNTNFCKDSISFGLSFVSHN